jgi:hypothetical protein
VRKPWEIVVDVVGIMLLASLILLVLTPFGVQVVAG